jgi:hypothetical protein
MITNTGKTIISKYMLGQAPAYASYMAVGCGKKPLATSDPYGDYSTQESLNFEMFRVPISSRGFVNENGINKIVLTAELPTEERYEITEIGLYSAGSNPSAGAYDSKTVFAFTTGENWQYHTATSTTGLTTISSPLDDPNNDNIIAVTNPVFQTNADNSIFYKTSRSNRYERCRFLNNTILIAGNDANLQVVDNHLEIQSGSNHIHLTGADVNFTKNSPIDELRLAFSLVSKNGDSLAVPDNVRILVDFATTDEPEPTNYARFEVNIENGIDGVDFANNRYFVINKQLQELYTSANFTWDAVTVIKIYASVIDGGVTTDSYYIALDAMRLENIATTNPLYGLTGYSVIKNATSESIIKSPNTTNYIEFRFSIGVS